MKPAFQKWGLAREGDRKSRGEWVAKPGSFQPLLLPLPRVEGRALTLGTREQREFRGLVMATWSICKTYVCAHITTGMKVGSKEEILYSRRSRDKASSPRRFRSQPGRGFWSCSYSTEMIHLPGLGLVCPPSPTVPKSLKKSNKIKSLSETHTEAKGVHIGTLKPDTLHGKMSLAQGSESRIFRQEIIRFYHSRHYMQRRVFIRERCKWQPEELRW